MKLQQGEQVTRISKIKLNLPDYHKYQAMLNPDQRQ